MEAPLSIKETIVVKHKENKWPYIFLLPYLLLYGVFFIYPTLFSFIISLTNWDSLAGAAERKFVGLANYIKLFTTDVYFYKALGNTLFFMIIYIPIVIIGGLLLAVILYKLKKTSRFFQTINVMPYITTPVAIGIIFAFMFDWSTGIINNILLNIGVISDGINWLGRGGTARFVVILILVWKNLGYYLLVYLAGMSTIPEELSEAAIVDGASERQVFFHITIPYLKPITLFLIVTSIVGGLQLFDEPMLLFTGNGGNAIVGGPDRACLTSMIYFFDKTFSSGTSIGYGAAISYGIFIVIAILSLVTFKLLTRGGGEE